MPGVFGLACTRIDADSLDIQEGTEGRDRFSIGSFLLSLKFFAREKERVLGLAESSYYHVDCFGDCPR